MDAENETREECAAYSALARWYDGFTRDVPYMEFADYYCTLLCCSGKARMTLLDLCCGTGTMTLLLARRGHTMIGADASPEMLSLAAEKAIQADAERFAAPLLLCQAADELDLYGTVEGAFCSLDGMNYLPPETLPETLRRLHLFIEPGGVFAFDIHDPACLRARSGGVFVDETEDALCLWRGDFDEEENALIYGIDLFRRADGQNWRRAFEEHIEYAHTPEKLTALLERAGFTDVTLHTDGPQHEMGRLFLSAVNLPH